MTSFMCAGCQEPIMERCLIKGLDKSWHAQCLKCSECQCLLSEKCFSRDNKLYCRSDYFRQYGTQCSSCKVGMCPEDMVRRPVENKVYHVECFKCSVCESRLNTGEQIYFVQGENFLCDGCYPAPWLQTIAYSNLLDASDPNPNPYLNPLLINECRHNTLTIKIEKAPVQLVSQASNFNFFKIDSDEAYSKKPKPLLKDTSHGVIPSKSSLAVMVEKDSNESSRRRSREPLTMPTKSRSSVCTISTRSLVKQTKQPVPEIMDIIDQTFSRQQASSRNDKRSRVQSPKPPPSLSDTDCESDFSDFTIISGEFDGDVESMNLIRKKKESK